MEIAYLHELESRIENWDGKISLDTYYLEDPNSVMVLTFHSKEGIQGLVYRGKHEEVVTAIHFLATRYNHKVVESQREDIKKIDEVTSHPVP